MKRTTKPKQGTKTYTGLYPHLNQLGIKMRFDNGVHYVLFSELKKKLSAKKRKELDSFLGPITMSTKGPYPWDIEYALSSLAIGIKKPALSMWD